MINKNVLKRWFRFSLIVVIIFVAAVLVLGLITMVFWNLIMPTIFNLPKINFWQAIALQIMSSLLIRNSVNFSKSKNKSVRS